MNKLHVINDDKDPNSCSISGWFFKPRWWLMRKSLWFFPTRQDDFSLRSSIYFGDFASLPCLITPWGVQNFKSVIPNFCSFTLDCRHTKNSRYTSLFIQIPMARNHGNFSTFSGLETMAQEVAWRWWFHHCLAKMWNHLHHWIVDSVPSAF